MVGHFVERRSVEARVPGFCGKGVRCKDVWWKNVRWQVWGRLVKEGPVDERCVVYVYPTYIYKMHLQVPTVLVSQHCHK